MIDLIFSVIRDRRWQDIDCYALSLASCGYKGRKLMFVDQVPQDAQDNLKSLGFDLIQYQMPRTGLHFQTWRFFPAQEYLLEHWNEFRYIMWTDVCDLVFQKDPMEWVDKNMYPAKLVGAREGRRIKNSGINDVWIRKFLNDDEYLPLREQDVLCSGTIQGESRAMLDLFTAMRDRIPGISGMQGIDQGLFNYVVRLPQFRNILYIPGLDQGFISTCGMFLSKGDDPQFWDVEPPYFNRETAMVMTTDKSQDFYISHCYNRQGGVCDPSGDWRQIVERRYRGA